ncbi:MAG: M15 family metallopeptidase [Saprospiraceae bacterium]
MYTISFIFSVFIWVACGQTHSIANQKTEAGVDTNSSILKKDTIPSKKEKFTVDYVMGHFDPATHPDFTAVDSKYADREGMFLRRDTYEAFRRMYEHALSAGIRLQIRSATRNFDYQKGIWEAKWTGAKLIEGGENLAQTTPEPKERALKILRYSAMPGSSRHHWGTDIDLNSFENSWFDEGDGLKMYKWLKRHAVDFGFCQPYTAGRLSGYLEERWHWSYMPISIGLTALAKKDLKNEMITGFKGSETAGMIDVVKKYVLGINEDCE